MDYGARRLEAWTGLAEILERAATAIAARMQQTSAKRNRVRRGGTLRPGIDTPMWQAVVQAVRPHLSRRGEKALLARELGVHRARIGEYFIRGTAMPDAERMLLLLVWLARRQAKRNK